MTLLLILQLSRGPLAELQWSRAHHGAASLGRRTLRLPFGWRSMETEDRHGGEEIAELVLRRDRWNWLHGRSVDEIDLREASLPFDPVELAQRWDRAQTRSMIPGDRLEPTPTAPFLREHYRCSDRRRAEDGTISLGCFAREGRWAVWYRGRQDGIRDLVAILGSATDDGAATR